MKVLIIYCHPSENSFTRNVRDKVVECLLKNEHTYEISDLYKMNFNTDMSEAEYLREANYDESIEISADVKKEQEKINSCDVLIFIYPVFWTEAPAKLVGWFDRVWTYGFAYGNKRMKMIKKSIFLCVAGRTCSHLSEHGQLDAMKSIMIGDRLFERSESNEMYVLDGMSKANESKRNENWSLHINLVDQVIDKLCKENS
jgi:NAD(P)H dehydrogenase (quinone)